MPVESTEWTEKANKTESDGILCAKSKININKNEYNDNNKNNQPNQHEND